MDLDGLQLLLDELHAALDGETVQELDSTVQGICMAVSRVFADSEVDSTEFVEQARRVCAILCDTSGARDAISYIRRSLAVAASTRGPIPKAREQLLYVLSNLIPLAREHVYIHLEAIHAVCLTVVRMDGTSDGAKAALAPLSTLLTHTLLSADTFKAAEVFMTVIDAVRSTASVYHKQDGPKGMAFAFLGQLVATYPDCFDAKKVRDGAVSASYQPS
jgi:hypothetical protein